MKLRRIGAPVNEGCDIHGSQLAIQSLQTRGLTFETVVTVEKKNESEGEILHLNTLHDFLTRLKHEVTKTDQAGEFPLVYGGDHSLAIATIAALDNKNRGVLWIDAHGDCNTHLSSESKRIHGMPLAVAQGYGHPKLLEIVGSNTVDSDKILLVGIRSLDEKEEELMKSWGLKWITQDDIDINGFEWTKDQVKSFLEALDEIHLSFDVDSMDPSLCPGVSTPVGGGLTPDQALDLVELGFDSVHVSSMDIVEFNPVHDQGKTVELILRMDAMVQSKLNGECA
ncbi:MAG: hypothetical protein A2Y19_06195 [Firmicutes bacterium GWE2_51_13]|nr:MAG: hypothetical protein A2Y19_06195 [Firmicutes bacterium GWE2_51_13]